MAISLRIPALLIVVLLGSCATDHETTATLAVKDYVDAEMVILLAAAIELRDAAPAPDADGWSATDDRAAVDAMRAAWLRARVAYEHIEGALAVLFPHIDHSTDQRYDAFIEAGPDAQLFDGEGVTGMHGIERILWAGEHPPEVIAFESALPGYQEARQPANEAEARAFRDELLQRLIDDVTTMQEQFAPLALDPAAAFRGVIGSMGEQLEKVQLAATGEDESRYSQLTLLDMRANLAGGRAIYAPFAPWIRSVDGGSARDARIEAGFERLAAAYAALPGDSLPTVPDGWNPDAPDPAHLEMSYGQLWHIVSSESDPSSATSLVSEMTAAADSIGIPTLP